MSNNHIINFSLDRETVRKFMSGKGAKLEKRNNKLEVVFSDSRIKLDIDKKEPATASYYNNKSSNLHFLGSTVTAKATHVMPKKIKERGVELLDIPSSTIITTPTSPAAAATKPVVSSKLKKPSLKSTTLKPNQSTIPSRGSSVTPQNTPRPSSNNRLSPPVEKLSDRVIQLLAIKPYQVTTMAKALDTTSWDVKKIVDDVGICIPDQSSQKKKYCLKPQLYRNVRIWDWPLYSQEEKTIVSANAKEAYDILQLAPDAVERSNLIDPNKLIQPPPGKVAITTDRDRAIAAKKIKSAKKTEEKKLDLKGKGKPFTYPVAASEPAAPTPSPIVNKLKTTTVAAASAATAARNALLKPSSSNKKVGAKGLPHVSPPPAPEMKRKEVNHTSTASKRTKSSDFSHHGVVELSEIPSQSVFDKYCAKFLMNQKEYQNTKMNFKSKYPYYIKALENTKPPTGSKRSYYDLKLEYHDMVKDTYLKTEDESSWQEAESQLRDCNEKRRRLNFMWSSIQKNLSDHQYKLNLK